MMKAFVLFLLMLFSSNLLFSQRTTVTNTDLSDNKIIINYSIDKSKFYQKFNVSLYVSTDGGENYTGPLIKVSGDIGNNVSAGENTIVWDVLSEMPVLENEFVFDVRIEVQDEMKKQVFVQYVGNLITPLGFRIGKTGKTGIFLEARASTLLSKGGEYGFSDDVITNFNKAGYYQFSNKDGYAALSVVGGINYQISLNTFFFAGAGYGIQKYIIQINEYEYSSDGLVGTDWAESLNESYSGLEFDTGILFKNGSLLFGVGATVLNFKVFNFTASMGIAF